MCQVLLALGAHPDYPLVLAANRDEFYQRPTAAATFWADHPDLLAGRDLQAGGTWLGVTRSGRWAAVTNRREGKPATAACSRGALVADYLSRAVRPQHYLKQRLREADRYAGFNLLLGDRDSVFYASNREPDIIELERGIHGLSNGSLNNAWPKVEDGKTQLASALASATPDWAAIARLLADTRLADDERLPDTGVGLARERALSAQFIVTPGYGTRCSSILSLSKDGVLEFHERRFGPGGMAEGESRFRWRLAR